MSHSFPYVVPPTKRGAKCGEKCGPVPRNECPCRGFLATRTPFACSVPHGAAGPSSRRARLRSRSSSFEQREYDNDGFSP
jgi:hypothetical protein